MLILVFPLQVGYLEPKKKTNTVDVTCPDAAALTLPNA